MKRSNFIAAYVNRMLSVFFMIFLVSAAAVAQSPYTVEVNIPEYDAENSDHFLIQSKADWSHINDADKHYFYVKPNVDYGKVTITADGTASAQRYISLYNGNDTHPAKLNQDEQAFVEFVFNNAQYWIIDRMSSKDFGDADTYCYEIKEKSGHIVFNRFNLINFYHGIIIRGAKASPYTHDITIQNSRFDRMSDAGIDGDAVAIMLMGNYWNTPGRVLNTKILNNEIKNSNDGIMMIKMPQFVGNGTYWVDYPGTIIDYNHIYVDTTVYTDGSGNHDVNGIWALTENAVDIKGGSDDPNNPMIVSNNYFWGYRRTDENGGGSGSWGTALAVHYHTKNLLIKNNVIFNSNRGLAFSGLEGTPYTAEDVVIENNTFYDIGYNTDGETGYCVVFNDAKGITFDGNTIVGIGQKAHWVYIGSERDKPSDHINISCNAVINSAIEGGERALYYTHLQYNYFYNTSKRFGCDGWGNEDAKMTDLVFTTDNYTDNPYQVTLNGVKKTNNSPHNGTCFDSVPKRANVPTPENGETNIALTQKLSWLKVGDADSYDIYFGKNYPPEFVQNQTGITFDPGELEKNTIYYWRVDTKKGSQLSAGFDWAFTSGDSSGVKYINYARNKKVTYSSQENELHSAKNLVDGIIGRDCMRWSAGVMPQWVEVDLGENYSICRTEVVCYLDRSYRFKVEIKEDGASEYVQVVDRLDNTQHGTIPNPITDNFNDINARYVKITVVESGDPDDYNGTWASISEFRIFGKDPATAISSPSAEVPKSFNLTNYPNPFNPSTMISFSIPRSGHVTAKIYNVAGKEVAELTNRIFQAGKNEIKWNGRDNNGSRVSSGLYFCRVRYENQIKISKMVLVR